MELYLIAGFLPGLNTALTNVADGLPCTSLLPQKRLAALGYMPHNPPNNKPSWVGREALNQRCIVAALLCPYISVLRYPY